MEKRKIFKNVELKGGYQQKKSHRTVRNGNRKNRNNKRVQNNCRKKRQQRHFN